MVNRFAILILLPLLGFPAVRAADPATQDWILPILVGGTPSGNAFYGSNLHVMNLSSTTAELQVTVFAGDVDDPLSEPQPVEQTRPQLRLKPGQADRLQLRLQEIGDERPGLRQGWARLKAPPGVPLHLAVELTDFREDGEGTFRATSSVMVEAMRPARSFGVFAAWEGSFGCFPTRQSAYAFVNPATDERARVEMVLNLRQATGQERTLRRTLEIAPGGRVPIFLSQLFPGLFPERGRRSAPCIALFNQPTGVLQLSSDIPIAVGALDVDLRNGQFVNLPVSPR